MFELKNFKCKLVIILQLSLCFIQAQDFDFINKYQSLSQKDQNKYFDSLSDATILLNSNFFISEFNSNIKEDKDIKTSNFNLAKVYRLSNNHIKSINILKALLKDTKVTLAKQDSLKLYTDLKQSYFKFHLYPEIFDVNKNISELINKGAKIDAWEYNLNSKIYAKLDQLPKAINSLKAELKELITFKERDSLVYPSGLNDLGFYYFSLRKNDSALHYFNKALAKAEISLKNNDRNNYNRLVAVVKGNIASIYMQENEYLKAIPLLKEDISIGLKEKDNLVSTFKSYNYLTECYLEQNLNEKAYRTFKEIESFFDEDEISENSIKLSENMAKYYSSIKQLDSSIYHYSKAFKLKDLADKQKIKSVLESNELLYTRAKQQKINEQHKIDLKNQEIALKNKQNKLSKIFLSVLALLLIISLYLMYIFLKRRKEVEQKNNEISHKNDLIEQALKEKEVLFKEVHHRVKNNLQIISGILELQNINIKDENVKIALKEGQNRIQSIALVHKMMYQSKNVSKVNMQLYLTELIENLKQTFAKNNQDIDVNIFAENIDFDLNIAVPLSLIVNEIVCNSFKHAFLNKKKGELNVELEQFKSNVYLLTISDNGIGLPANFNINSLNSVGFDLIKGLSRQIKGKLKYASSEKGTIVKVEFKTN